MKASGELCAVLGPGCDGRAAHIHHRQMRSQGGSLTDPENTLPVCSTCHRRIHDHPARSYEMGWLVHSWQDPAEVPVQQWRAAS